MANMSSDVDSLRLSKLPHFIDEAGELTAIDASVTVPFLISRVFFVRAPHGAVRGQHAHLACSQFLICPSGSVFVRFEDGERAVDFALNSPDLGIFVPPGIWSQQAYIGDNAVLMVLCDKPFEESDYIRDYEEFKLLRRATRDS